MAGQASISPDILARYAADAALEIAGVRAVSESSVPGRRGVRVTTDDGSVRVEVGRVLESQLPAGVRLPAPVRIAVADTGPGIAAEDLPRLFDPFFSTRRGGTGLGLALVHRAVEAHNGAIFVEPGAGEGASFQVFLPSQSENRA